MEIKRISNNNIYSYKWAINQRLAPNKNIGIKIPDALKTDTISFSARLPQIDPKQKMRLYAVNLIKQIGLKEDQPIHITAESKYVPFLRIFSEEAYKNGSGKISFEIIEPEIEALKKKYNITEDFDYKKELIEKLKEKGALFLNFNALGCPYKQSGLTKKETSAQIKSLYPNIPAKIQNIFKLDPGEIFKTILDMHEGESAYIQCQREHMPKVIKLVEWLYSKNKTKLVDVFVIEPGEFDFDIARRSYAKPTHYYDYNFEKIIPRGKEYLKKDTARLFLVGDDPNYNLSEIKRKIKFSNEEIKEINDDYYSNFKIYDEIRKQQMSNNPWVQYYLPTIRSISNTYSEFGTNKLEAYQKSLEDAKSINRAGHINEHVEELDKRAEKLNKILDKDYRTFHYISVDPKTKQPDGKTDFKVKISPISFFVGARTRMEKTGHNTIVNIPSEEVFASPANNSAEGVVYATLPFKLWDDIIKDVKFRFEEGKVTEVESLSAEILKKHISKNSGADRLGEVAIVADSPIYKLGKLFNETLIDENSTCHLALGFAFPENIKGLKEINGFEQQQEYLEKLNINTSLVHNDFMVGGPDVYVYAENNTGERIPVIINDKFVL